MRPKIGQPDAYTSSFEELVASLYIYFFYMPLLQQTQSAEYKAAKVTEGAASQYDSGTAFWKVTPPNTDVPEIRSFCPRLHKMAEGRRCVGPPLIKPCLSAGSMKWKTKNLAKGPP